MIYSEETLSIKDESYEEVQQDGRTALHRWAGMASSFWSHCLEAPPSLSACCRRAPDFRRQGGKRPTGRLGLAARTFNKSLRLSSHG